MTDAKDTPLELGTATRLFPKGRLKIFLGASPGVGKTFAMLQAAAERVQEGIDVVVGLAETHKRKETEDQLVNLEVMPRKIVPYRGKTFEELDLDGVLARAPQLILIDECAHSNLPGSRHPKRYNDIEEIRDHGIDVYTTLNIQHLESLKDVVGQMTHITVRESIPDSFFESANEVQLIDLPPDDLLQRLADGKVYVPDQAKAAANHFFSRSNLLSLRELALRRAITVADDEMSHYNKEHQIKGPWPASDKVMVCVGSNHLGPHLVRAACRIAERLQARWIAVNVETSHDEDRPIDHQKQLTQTLHLAEELGATVTTLEGDSVAKTLVHYAMTQNVTDLVVGQSQKKTIWDKLPLVKRQSTAEQILSYRPSLMIRVMPPENKEPYTVPSGQSSSFQRCLFPYLLSFLMTLGALIVARQVNSHNLMVSITPIFFLGILFVSIQFGLKPALLVTIMSSLVYDYYFLAPQYQFGIQGFEGWISFLSFVSAASILSFLTVRFRDVFSASQGRLRQVRFFAAFVRDLMSCSHKDQVLHHLCHQLNDFIGVSVIAFWDDQENFMPVVQYPNAKPVELGDTDTNAIQWALAHHARAGQSTETFSDAHYLYLPIKLENNSLGVVGVRSLKGSLTLDDFRITQILVDQAALAIDRLSYLKGKITKEKTGKTL